MCADWNQLFRDPDKILRRPDPLADEFTNAVNPGGVVCDLGCGAGRHLVRMAEAGLEVIGGDISPVGLNLSRQWLEKVDLSVSLILAGMTSLPFASETVDGVLSVNVLNHGTVAKAAEAVGEVHRILKTGGLFFFLIIGRQDARYGEGDEIEPHTFIHREGIEAGVPHHFYTPEELSRLVQSFTRHELQERTRPYDDCEPVFGNDPRLKDRRDAVLQHWEVKACK